MKTFGLFMLLFVTFSITNTILLRNWKTPEIIIQSTILAYIMQQYFIQKINRK